jgi:hypothetical protein
MDGAFHLISAEIVRVTLKEKQELGRGLGLRILTIPSRQ